MTGHDHVATAVILDQFYKNPELPALAEPGVAARAIQLGVKEKALGLAELRGEELDPTTLKYGEDIPLAAVSFEPGVYLVSREKAEEFVAQLSQEKAEEERTEPEEEEREPDKTYVTDDTEPVDRERKYKRVRLVVKDIPTGKIADVNRGILMPLSAVVGEFKFTLEIDVSSAEGISHSTLENKVKETIRQIGATLREGRE